MWTWTQKEGENLMSGVQMTNLLGCFVVLFPNSAFESKAADLSLYVCS